MRLPRPTRRSAPRRGLAPAPAPDARIWGRHHDGIRPWAFGLIVAVIFTALVYLAFFKNIPFTEPGYEVRATFDNAATLRPSSPVRIAGVTVGEVTEVTGEGDAAEVTFTVNDEGRPLHEDATIEIRPRLFLEGNFFLDVRPGSPSAPELADGGEIPMTQTSTAVQLDEVLTSLQSNSRRNLKRLLEGYGTTLTYEPTAADDETHDPDVAGETAAASINDSFATGGRAGKGTAIVGDALRGERPHDLSGLVRSLRGVFTKLDDREAQLQGLISNLNVTTGALASESQNLSASVRELAPTLEQAEPSLARLSEALPPLRALARELEPGVRELPDTIDAAGPWLDQTALLLRDRELGGLTRLLLRSTPGLAETTHATRRLFPQLELSGRCANEVLGPTGDIVVADAFSSGQPNFRELLYGFADTAGEGAGFDGNGSYLRFQAGGGPVTVQMPNPGGQLSNEVLFGKTVEAPQGTQPAYPATGMPPFRMDVPCHRNAVPDVNGAAIGPPSPEVVGP